MGNIKFIGELFKLKMLTEVIMHDCIVKLLKNHDEESLECLCRLLSTIGKDLDFEKAKVRQTHTPSPRSQEDAVHICLTYTYICAGLLMSRDMRLQFDLLCRRWPHQIVFLVSLVWTSTSIKWRKS